MEILIGIGIGLAAFLVGGIVALWWTFREGMFN